MKRSSSETSKLIDRENLNVGISTARFTFKNGDTYEGKYRVNVDRRVLVKQDQGVYTTDNFDVYDGKWCDDAFGSDEFHIRYHDDARYKGSVGAKGTMNGTGTYTFPDGSSLTAVWSRNKPVSDIVFREPLGHEWTTASISDNHVTLTTANQYWNEIPKEEIWNEIPKESLEGNSSSSV